MSYTPESQTPGTDVRIGNLSTALGFVAAIGGEGAVVYLPEYEAAMTFPSEQLPKGIAGGNRVRVSSWSEESDSLAASRQVVELRKVRNKRFNLLGLLKH